MGTESTWDYTKVSEEAANISEQAGLINKEAVSYENEADGSLAIQRFGEIYDSLVQLVSDFCDDVGSDAEFIMQLVADEQANQEAVIESTTLE